MGKMAGRGHESVSGHPVYRNEGAKRSIRQKAARIQKSRDETAKAVSEKGQKSK